MRVISLNKFGEGLETFLSRTNQCKSISEKTQPDSLNYQPLLNGEMEIIWPKKQTYQPAARNHHLNESQPLACLAG